MEKDLVSILTPCYNSEEYIKRMLDSILQQTYCKIELICIDDGSIDKTGQIIKEYIPLFKGRGRELIYIYKEHNGQAAAINAGLKIMKGEYFGLLDSDDYLAVDSIEKRIAALEQHPECSLSVSDYYIVNEEDLTKVQGRGNSFVGNLCYQPYQFYLLLTGYSVVTPLAYLIRTADFLKINASRTINECKEGQNYQILLPLYYYYKRFYIDEPLGYYVVRKQSHGHMTRTSDEIRERYGNLLQMLQNILEELPMGEEEIRKCLRISSFNNHLEGL